MKIKNIIDYTLIGLICFGVIFWMIMIPIVLVFGIISGRIDIETLEPVSIQEQIMEENMIQIGGFGAIKYIKKFISVLPMLLIICIGILINED